jgi:hypothetical protein
MKHTKSSDSFKGRIGDVHGDWMGSVTGIPHVGRSGGIDLLDSDVAIELKTKLNIYSESWACNENDRIRFLGNNDDREVSWAFMLYGLSRPVKEIYRRRDLERYVTLRETWILSFDWILQYPVHCPEKSGPFRYPKRKDFPSHDCFFGFEYDSSKKIYVHKDCPIALEKINSSH